MGNAPYAIIAVIEQQVAEKLTAYVESRMNVPGNLAGASPQDLWQQLHGQELIPQGLDLSFLEGMSALTLPFGGPKSPVDVVRTLFKGQKAGIERLLAADSPEDALAVCKDLFRESLNQLGGTIGALLGNQLSILVSLATTAVALPTKAGPAIEDALLRYFFSPQGYKTVDGFQLVAPIHLADVDLAKVGQVPALSSERTAERYVRDLVRVMVEAADDVRYDDLKSRYKAILARLHGENARDKFASWFRGFASIAEAAVTSSVEEVCLGIAGLQTNALIAASAGTFAGTAARKAAQHVFLSELEYLGRPH